MVRPSWLERYKANPQQTATMAGVALSWVAWLLSLWVLFLRLSAADPKTLSMWISSDTLYPVNVITDTVIDGYSFSGWRFSIAPCWFPDLIATWIFMGLTRNVIAATLLAGFMQIGLLVYGLKLAWRATGHAVAPIQEVLGLAAATAITLYVAVHPGLYYPGLYQLFLPQTHVGSLLVVIYALAFGLMILRQQHQDQRTNAAVVAGYVTICVLAGMSNLMFSAHMLGPLTVVGVLAAFLGLLRWRPVGFVLAAGWLAMLLGFSVNRTAFHTTDLSAQSDRSFERIMVSLEVFTRGFVRNTLDWDGLHIAALLSLLVATTVLLFTLRSAVIRGLDRVGLADRLVAVMFGVLAASALLGMVAIVTGGSNGLAVIKDYHWSMHYLHPAFLLPLVSLPFAFGAMLAKHTRWSFATQAGCLLVASVSAVFAGAYALNTPRPAGYITEYRPALVRHLDELAKTEKLRTGIGGYWQARLITLLSQTGVRAYAVDGAMTPFLWVSNSEWYKPIYKEAGKPDFVVLDDPLWKLNASAAYARFGFPLREATIEGTRVLLYKCATCTEADRAAAASRTSMEQPLVSFAHEVAATPRQVSVTALQPFTVPVKFKNAGDRPWSSSGRYPVHATYKLYRDGAILPVEGERTSLPGALHPGDTATMEMRAVAPGLPGTYDLRLTLVQEGVAWFMTETGTSSSVRLIVR
jgi:hypothetical protein